MSYKSPSQQRHVPASSDSSDILRPGDPLGSFVGYLRRSKSTPAGLVAQFFGENGPDADVISALHLTRFLDANVKVTVWMMKDRNGKMIKQNGEHLKLTEFIGVIRRPLPSNAGQVAQFFGENGPNSDAINILNQSDYLDALVFVEMHQAVPGMTTKDVMTPPPEEELSHHASRMTPTEAAEFKKLQKRAQEAMKVLLLHGFFRMDPVLFSLGKDTEFQAWVEQQSCCHPGETPCDGHPVQAWSSPDLRRYQKIPLCSDHAHQWNNGTVVLPDGSSPASFAQSQSIFVMQRWAQSALSKQLNVPADRLPTPGAVYAWASEKKLLNLLPASYKAFLA